MAHDDITWVVTGAGGMLGRDLVGSLHRLGESVLPCTRADLDVTDPEAVDAAVAAASAEVPVAEGIVVVVNLAAWTDVDGAEDHEDEARAVNSVGALNVARACLHTGARMIHLSTDYVFDGNATKPYSENSPRSPVSAYGRTKAEGELAVLETLPDSGIVLRTAWLYGAHGANFVLTMIRLAAECEYLEVVDDQFGQPTWTGDLAQRIIKVGHARNARGVFHATNAGSTTWYGLARAVLAARGFDPDRVRPTTTDRFSRSAPRPAFSVLSHARWTELGLPPMRPWQEALDDAMSMGSVDGGVDSDLLEGA